MPNEDIDRLLASRARYRKTTAQVVGAEWLSTLLLRGAGADAKQISMTTEKYTDMRCPNVNNIVVLETDKSKGGEKIDIFGMPKN